MATCTKCGAQLTDNENTCPYCGTRVSGHAFAGGNGAGIGDKISDFTNTYDATDEFDPNDIQQNKGMAVISYLSLLVIVPLLAVPNSKYARYHANQGLVLLLAEVAWMIASNVVYSILIAISSIFYFISVIFSLFNIVFLVFSIIGIVNAANGRAKELPIIGKFRLLK